MDDKNEDIPFVLETRKEKEEDRASVANDTCISTVFFTSQKDGWVWICKQVNEENYIHFHSRPENEVYYENMLDPIYSNNYAIKVMGSNWFIKIPWVDWFNIICERRIVTFVGQYLIERTIEYLNSDCSKAVKRYDDMTFVFKMPTAGTS